MTNHTKMGELRHKVEFHRWEKVNDKFEKVGREEVYVTYHRSDKNNFKIAVNGVLTKEVIKVEAYRIRGNARNHIGRAYAQYKATGVDNMYCKAGTLDQLNEGEKIAFTNYILTVRKFERRDELTNLGIYKPEAEPKPALNFMAWLKSLRK